MSHGLVPISGGRCPPTCQGNCFSGPILPDQLPASFAGPHLASTTVATTPLSSEKVGLPQPAIATIAQTVQSAAGIITGQTANPFVDSFDFEAVRKSQCLNLAKTCTSEENVIALIESLHQKEIILCRVDLSYSKVGDKTVAILETLYPLLEELDLRGTLVTSNTINPNSFFWDCKLNVQNCYRLRPLSQAKWPKNVDMTDCGVKVNMSAPPRYDAEYDNDLDDADADSCTTHGTLQFLDLDTYSLYHRSRCPMTINLEGLLQKRMVGEKIGPTNYRYGFQVGEAWMNRSFKPLPQVKKTNAADPRDVGIREGKCE